MLPLLVLLLVSTTTSLSDEDPRAEPQTGLRVGSGRAQPQTGPRGGIATHGRCEQITIPLCTNIQVKSHALVSWPSRRFKPSDISVQPDNNAKPVGPCQARGGRDGGASVFSPGESTVFKTPPVLPLQRVRTCLYNIGGGYSSLQASIKCPETTYSIAYIKYFRQVFVSGSSGGLRGTDEQVWLPVASFPGVLQVPRRQSGEAVCGRHQLSLICPALNESLLYSTVMYSIL